MLDCAKLWFMLNVKNRVSSLRYIYVIGNFIEFRHYPVKTLAAAITGRTFLNFLSLIVFGPTFESFWYVLLALLISNSISKCLTTYSILINDVMHYAKKLHIAVNKYVEYFYSYL